MAFKTSPTNLGNVGLNLYHPSGLPLNTDGAKWAGGRLIVCGSARTPKGQLLEVIYNRTTHGYCAKTWAVEAESNPTVVTSSLAAFMAQHGSHELTRLGPMVDEQENTAECIYCRRDHLLFIEVA